MKLKLFAPAALALALGLANWSASAANIYAEVVPAADATRTIVITPDTKWVNATDAETVKFVSNGQTFAVDFEGQTNAFPLNAIAPAGALDHHVEAYVRPAPGENAGG
jgi:type II secretory pathway component PulK